MATMMVLIIWSWTGSEPEHFTSLGTLCQKFSQNQNLSTYVVYILMICVYHVYISHESTPMEHTVLNEETNSSSDMFCCDVISTSKTTYNVSVRDCINMKRESLACNHQDWDVTCWVDTLKFFDHWDNCNSKTIADHLHLAPSTY